MMHAFPCTADTRVIVIGGPGGNRGSGPPFLSGYDVGRFTPARRPENAATSASSSYSASDAPKAAVHFIRQQLSSKPVSRRYVYKMTPEDVVGGAAPCSLRVSGTFTLLPFEGGAARDQFSPQEMMETITRHRMTVLTGLPTAYRRLLKYPDFKWYAQHVAPAAATPSARKRLRPGNSSPENPSGRDWAGREMLHLVTSNTMNPEPVPNSIGKPLPGVP